MHALLTDATRPDPGLYQFAAEIHTEHRIFTAALTGAEFRLSDLLNGSLSTVPVMAQTVTGRTSGARRELPGSYTELSKNHIFLVVPVTEPERPAGQGNIAWKRTDRHRCRIGAGPYDISGEFHTEAGYDPRFALRRADKQFMPVTNVTVEQPDGATDSYDAIIVNRLHVDSLVLLDR